MAHEVEIHHLKGKASSRPKYEQPQCVQDLFGHWTDQNRAFTESAISLLNDNISAKSRILSWFLDYLRVNPLQRALYVDILRSFSIDDDMGNCEQIEDRAARFWDIDSSIDKEESSKGNISDSIADKMAGLLIDENAISTISVWSPEIEDFIIEDQNVFSGGRGRHELCKT
ncbi:hypothetical protein GQ44DRAFT_769825 [Phaeosphaeriaceae sp. PMI808]|nr:hypothetical protein GQ44DRAFT_769825 [Phaeosphaeriaceae sp. PMI808]